MANDSFLRPKRRGQSITVFEFILPFGRLNLVSLALEKKEEFLDKTGLRYTEAMEIFEYGKNNDEYWDRAKLAHCRSSPAIPNTYCYFSLIMPRVIQFMQKIRCAASPKDE